MDLKSLVYRRRPTTLQGLTDNIMIQIGIIQAKVLRNAGHIKRLPQLVLGILSPIS